MEILEKKIQQRQNSSKWFYYLIKVESKSNLIREVVDPENFWKKMKSLSEEKSKEKQPNKLQQFLLTGPTMSDEAYEEYLEKRKHFNKWH